MVHPNLLVAILQLTQCLSSILSLHHLAKKESLKWS